jgi:hypothetical protein
MKGHAVLNKEGKLVAFAVMDRPRVGVDYKTAKTSMARPVLTNGQSFVEIDIKPESLELMQEDLVAHVHAVATAKLQEARHKK